jgi:hypothetical protein
MKLFPPVLALSLLCALCAQPTSQAWAQAAAGSPAAEADAHYKRAVGLFNEADYGVALIEFKRAYEIAPAFQVLYNIGETYYQLQDYAGALRTLEKYLADGGDKVPAERRGEVTKELEKLRLRVAKVEIVVAEPGIDISVDDVAVGKTPLAEALLVSAGRRKITATQAGHPPVVKTVDLAGGDSVKVSFDLAAPAPTGTATPDAPAGRDVPVWPWIGTGVLAIGAGVFGGLALAASGDQKNLLGKADADPAALKKGHDNVVTMAGVADGFLIGTAAMGVVSIVLTATAGPKKAEAPPKTTGFAPVLTRVSAGPGGIRVVGTF